MSRSTWSVSPRVFLSRSGGSTIKSKTDKAEHAFRYHPFSFPEYVGLEHELRILTNERILVRMWMLHSLALDGRNQVQQAFQQSKMQYYHTVPLRSSSEVPCPFRESLREEGLSESVQFMLYSATFHKFVDCISAGTHPIWIGIPFVLLKKSPSVEFVSCHAP